MDNLFTSQLTQDEIDKLCEEITNAIHKNDALNKELEKLDLEGYSCFHLWETYNGFTDKYEYCKICGEKR